MIIRAICGKELGISFCPNAIAYFVDLENKVLMHIYDDRGMVIVTKKSDKIINLYTKFSHLLNPHYIQEMSEIFERIE